MPKFITDQCIACGSCENNCPVSCIKEEDGKYVIDESECIDCGACQENCPADAIEDK